MIKKLFVIVLSLLKWNRIENVLKEIFCIIYINNDLFLIL
jgi:hypothetical protein